MSFVCARSNGEESNGRDDGGVGQLRSGSDDGVGDEVIDGLEIHVL